MTYDNYLKTEHWNKTRLSKLLKNPICQICDSSSGLNIHHKYYSKRGESILFSEENKDLITLCRSCHRLVHSYFGTDVKKINKKLLQTKNLIKMGAKKNKAFWAVSNNLYIPIVHGDKRICLT